MKHKINRAEGPHGTEPLPQIQGQMRDFRRVRRRGATGPWHHLHPRPHPQALPRPLPPSLVRLAHGNSAAWGGNVGRLEADVGPVSHPHLQRRFGRGSHIVLRRHVALQTLPDLHPDRPLPPRVLMQTASEGYGMGVERLSRTELSDGELRGGQSCQTVGLPAPCLASHRVLRISHSPHSHRQKPVSCSLTSR